MSEMGQDGSCLEEQVHGLPNRSSLAQSVKIITLDKSSKRSMTTEPRPTTITKPTLRSSLLPQGSKTRRDISSK